jgi:hypothetical protein
MHSFWLGHQPSPFNAPQTTGGLFTVHFATSFLSLSSHSFRVAIVTKQDGHIHTHTHTQKEEEEGLEKG